MSIATILESQLLVCTTTFDDKKTVHDLHICRRLKPNLNSLKNKNTDYMWSAQDKYLLKIIKEIP